MNEKIVGTVIAESKPLNEAFIKSCELIITNLRIIVNFTGCSITTSAMIGQAMNGASGAFGYGLDAKNKNEKNRFKNEELKKILQKPNNYEIRYEEINRLQSNFKTSFLNTLGIYASLNINTNGGKKYFFKIPNNQKNLAKIYFEIATDRIKL